MKSGSYISIENRIISTMRSLRDAHKYSQEYVAAELGINQNTYSKIESGQTQITIKRLEQLSKIYNIELTYFFNETTKETFQSNQHRSMKDTKKINTLLQILRLYYNYAPNRLAAELRITELEYHQIEMGHLKLTFRQAMVLSDLYNIEPVHLLATNNPVININYNIGSKSRGITNVNHYYEDSEKNSGMATNTTITHPAFNMGNTPSTENSA